MSKLTKQGVRDLNSVKPGGNTEYKVVRRKEEDGPDELDNQVGSDVIYDSSVFGEIRAAFPAASIERDYDFLHGTRLVVNPKCSKREWFTFLINNGLGGLSLQLQFSLVSPDSIRLISDLMDEIRPKWSKNK